MRERVVPVVLALSVRVIGLLVVGREPLVSRVLARHLQYSSELQQGSDS